ncbi:MAG: metallophosphoesterase [Chloroflexi bacterium]|nr:metallophosphoesterase [Chloroflexota bacterium]
MRALIISDKVEPILYSGGICDRVGKIDLILSCGDLPFYYIEFIISMLNKPAYYVMGNHGREFEYQSGKGDDAWNHQTSPQGAVNLHGHTAKEGPLLLAGLEGSIRYNDSAEAQYTDFEMRWNIAGLIPRLVRNRLRYGRWLDVLVAHSPPFGIHDQPDPAHRGFPSFLPFMRFFKPRYLLHGHIHLYRQNLTTVTKYQQTEVINVYPFRILELEPGVVANG